MEKCKETKHKYIHVRNESYSTTAGSRYQTTYKSLDYFFCEKCLDEQIIVKEECINDGEKHKLPEWARAIFNHKY